MYGPEPEDVKETLCPTQMVDEDGVMVIGDALDTFTIATAEVVQLPTPDFTVYVVVTAGETVTLAAATGNNPLLATQLNGPAPLADKT